MLIVAIMLAAFGVMLLYGVKDAKTGPFGPDPLVLLAGFMGSLSVLASVWLFIFCLIKSL